MMGKLIKDHKSEEPGTHEQRFKSYALNRKVGELKSRNLLH
jgi:hypothetical protein